MLNSMKKLTVYSIYFVNICLAVLSIAAIIKSVVVGFDIDEAYAVAQSYRLAIGDNMFSEMWESHQMSAFGSAIFILPYLLVTGGSTTGIVIYLRIVGTLIHLLIGWWLFRVARERYGTTAGLLIALVHINFLPKWITLPEFELMQYWSVCILFLALLSWAKDQQRVRYLLIAGAALFVALMTYPTMILLYPLYVVALLVLKEGSFKERIRPVIFFTLPPLIIGVCFLIYLFSYMTVGEFMEYISYIFMDESHSVSLSYRMHGFLFELREFAKQWYLPMTIAATALVVLAQYVFHKKKVSNIILTFFLLWVGVFSAKQLIFSYLRDTSQFFLYFRFMIAAALGIVGTHVCKKENRVYFWLGIMPGIVGLIASVMISNMTLEVAMARIYIAVVATCFIVCALLKDKYNENVLLKLVAYGVGVCFILGLLTCKLYLVRVTKCGHYSLEMNLEQVTAGPAIGLWVNGDLARQYNENIGLLESYVGDADNFLYFGCENIYYMVTDAVIASPSTQGTAVFNEMFLQYYEVHPDRVPNIVIIDKGFATNPNYYYSPDNQIMLDWIMEAFADAEVVETTYFTILKN